MNFKLDTGAEANALPQKIADKLSLPLNLQKMNTVLLSYEGAWIKPFGIVQTQLKQTHLDLFITSASDYC